MQQHCSTCQDNNCFISKYCSEESRREIGDAKDSRHFKARQQIIFEGSSVMGIYFIYSGAVKVFKGEEAKNYQIIKLPRSGDILGHRGYGNVLKYPISATAITNCTLCFIPNDVFLKALKDNFELTYELMMYYARELNTADSKVFHYVKMPVKLRVAEVILSLIEICGMSLDNPQCIDIPISRKDLANMAVTAYETTLRVLADFSETGILNYEGKLIRVLDLAKLEAVSTGAEA